MTQRVRKHVRVNNEDDDVGDDEAESLVPREGKPVELGDWEASSTNRGVNQSSSSSSSSITSSSHVRLERGSFWRRRDLGSIVVFCTVFSLRQTLLVRKQFKTRRLS